MCILLVEDEAVILEFMAESLRDAGYDVMTAGNADEAIELIGRRPNSFSALVSDLHMPGRGTGLDIAAAIRKHSGDIPVVLATGRPDVLAAPSVRSEGYTVLPKPYGPAQLVRTVGSLVALPDPRC